MSALNSGVVGRRNRLAVLETIRRHGSMSRVQMAAETNLTAATISNVVRDLIEARLVAPTGETVPRGPASAGPPAWLLALDRAYHRVLSVHQTADRVRLGIHDVGGNVLATTVLRPAPEEVPHRTIKRIASGLRRLVRQSDAHDYQVRAVGVSAIGQVDPETGTVQFVRDLGWVNVALRERLAEQLPWPVTVHRNTHALAAAELRFGDPLPSSALYVTVRVGIGSAVIINQAIVDGAHGQAMHLGHVRVPGGDHCTCGDTGCLQTVASIPAVARRATRALPDLPGGDSEHIVQAVAERAQSGEPNATAVVQTAATHLGYALAQIINVLDPGAIIVNSVLTQAGDAFLAAIAQSIDKETHAIHQHAVDIRPASLQETAGIVGAATLALDTHVYHPDATVLHTRPR